MYEYLDINEVKPGDVVECVVPFANRYTKGKLYIVAGIYNDMLKVIKCDDGYTNDKWGKYKFKLLKTMPGSTSKIGDKVLCTSDKKYVGQDWEVGEIYTICTKPSTDNNCRAKEHNWNNIENFVVLVKDNTQFNPRILSENIIINCRTKEQAEKLLKWADENGKRWSSKDKFISFTNWSQHSSDTCYVIRQGLYNNSEYHEANKQNIWSYEDALCINMGT